MAAPVGAWPQLQTGLVRGSAGAQPVDHLRAPRSADFDSFFEASSDEKVTDGVYAMGLIFI